MSNVADSKLSNETANRYLEVDRYIARRCGSIFTDNFKALSCKMAPKHINSGRLYSFVHRKGPQVNIVTSINFNTIILADFLDIVYSYAKLYNRDDVMLIKTEEEQFFLLFIIKKDKEMFPAGALSLLHITPDFANILIQEHNIKRAEQLIKVRLSFIK